MFPEVIQLQIFHRNTVDSDLAFCRLVETRNQVDEGCLSASRLSHDRHGLIRVNRKRNVMQNRQITVLILERNVVELDFSLEAFRVCHCIFLVLDLRLGVIQLHDFF